MEIKDGRGDHMSELKLENMGKIKEFFSVNKNATKKECAECTGLSYTTILKLIKEIENE